MEILKNESYIRVNGFTICYDDFGEGLIPVIFIHGFPFNRSSWEPQMNFLKESFRVIAFDIRGYGKSTAGKEEKSISLFADDLIAFMDGLKIDKAIVCGLSMGGYILFNAIDRYPGRFSAIILADTQCIADSPEVKEKRSQLILQITGGGIIEFASGFVKNIFCSTSLNTKTGLIEMITRIILDTAPETITATLNALAQRKESCSTLSNIKVPALIICGSEDTVTPLAQSDFLKKHIPNSVFYEIDNAGHMSNLEQPELFNQAVLKFITDLK